MATSGIKLAPAYTEERKKLDIRSGDTVKVWQKIVEKGKTRLQAFEGLVIATKHGKEAGATFTVRKVTSGVGVEKIFPLYSPALDKIEIVRRAKVRKAKLYYIRDKAAKEIRRKMKGFEAYVPVKEEKPVQVADDASEAPAVEEAKTE